MSSPVGVVIVDKEPAITSHQVVGQLRRLLGTRKVGHAGTLDPMATGVLILGVGRATRLLGHLALHDKRYRATIRLGERSTTDDADGEIEPVADASALGQAQLETAMARLRGQILQVPSSVSAIKVNGKRAYALAREGHSVELKARPVTVSRFDVLAMRMDHMCMLLEVEVECSSGTYIRALARDLGESLGLGGHLTALRRTRIGKYRIEDAVRLGVDAPPLMSMADVARLSFPVMEITEDETREVGYGRPLPRLVPSSPTGLIAPNGQLIALYQPTPTGSKPLAVLT